MVAESVQKLTIDEMPGQTRLTFFRRRGLGIGARNELAEVLIALVVLAEQNQGMNLHFLIARVFSGRGQGLLDGEATVRPEKDLTADDRLDAGILRGKVKVDRTEEVV